METYISVPKWAFRCVCLRWELWRILSWLYRSCLRHWLLSHFNNVKGAYKLMWLWKGSVLHFVGMMCKSQSSVSRQQHTFAELIVSGSISSGCMRSWMSSLTTLLMFLVNVACVCTDTCIYTTYILAEVQLLLVYCLQNRSAGTQLQCKLQSHRDWFFFPLTPNLLPGAVGSDEVSPEPPLLQMNTTAPSAAPHSIVALPWAKSLWGCCRAQTLGPSLLLLSPQLSHSAIWLFWSFTESSTSQLDPRPAAFPLLSPCLPLPCRAAFSSMVMGTWEQWDSSKAGSRALSRPTYGLSESRHGIVLAYVNTDHLPSY